MKEFLTKPDYQSLWEIIRERRSIRRYKPEVPDRAVLSRLVEAAGYAPSATNFQPWMFLVITNPAIREQMRQEVAAKINAWEPAADSGGTTGGDSWRDLATRHFLFFGAAPVVIAVCCKPYPATHICGEPFSPVAVARGWNLSVQSTAAAVQNMLLAAHSFGLGSCWLDGPLLARPELESLLQITDPWQLMCLVTLGYPDETPPPVKRKKIEFVTRFII